jgi:hypothetical protein
VPLGSTQPLPRAQLSPVSPVSRAPPSWRRLRRRRVAVRHHSPADERFRSSSVMLVSITGREISRLIEQTTHGVAARSSTSTQWSVTPVAAAFTPGGGSQGSDVTRVTRVTRSNDPPVSAASPGVTGGRRRTSQDRADELARGEFAAGLSAPLPPEREDDLPTLRAGVRLYGRVRWPGRRRRRLPGHGRAALGEQPQRRVTGSALV